MSSLQFHRDARAQLYSLVTGCFLDEAIEMERLFRSLTDDGPWIYELDEGLRREFSRLDEDLLGELAELWYECEEVEMLDQDTGELYDFIYQFAHFCHVATAGENLGVYIYSDS